MTKKNFFIYILKLWLKAPKPLLRALHVILVLTITFICIYLRVYLTSWHKDFIEALSNYSYDNFMFQLAIFFPIVICLLILQSLKQYLLSHLSFSWRKIASNYFISIWLKDRNYYDTSINDTIDNPDQRIAQDIANVTSNGLEILLLLIEKFCSLIIFSIILWDYSKLLHIHGKTIPGLLLWVAIVYCSTGTVGAYLVGKKIINLTINQEKKEANFRYFLIRIYEYAQAIAMRRGEIYEQKILQNAFSDIEINFYDLLWQNIKIDWYTNFYANINAFVPMLIVGPFYFLKEITLGMLMQINDIFDQVYNSLSQLIFNYKAILAWLAALERLRNFHNLISSAHICNLIHDEIIQIENVTLLNEENETICILPNINIRKGEKIWIRGASGSGKSTLLKTLAGLHKNYLGNITVPKDAIYIPAILYLPIGSLEDMLLYPAYKKHNDEIELAMEKLKLDKLKNYHNLAASSKIKQLSSGEKQRIMLIETLLIQHNWIFLDEPTSHLNSDLTKEVITALLEKNPSASIIIVSHDAYEESWFNQVIYL